MEDGETPRMRKYGESKTTRIMTATVPHVTSGLGLRIFQADGFLLTRVYIRKFKHRPYRCKAAQIFKHFVRSDEFPAVNMRITLLWHRFAHV